MHLAFGQETEIADGQELAAQPRGQPFSLDLMIGRRREVVHQVRVVLQVVELLARLLPPEPRLRLVQLPLLEQAQPDLGGWRLHLVGESLTVGPVDQEVPGVEVPLVADAPYQVVALVHAVGEAEDHLVRLRFVGAQEGPSLKVRGRLDPGQAQHRRREVDEADQAVRVAARFVVRGRQVPVLPGDRDDERHVQAGLERGALAPRQAGSVVAPVEDDRVVGQSRRLDLDQALSDERVHLGQLVVVLRPVLADLGRVRVVGRHADAGRVVDLRVRPAPDLALVGHGEVEDGEERRPLRPVPPVRLAGRLVPDRSPAAGLLEVVVLLRVVRHVIARLAQDLREEAEAVRQPGTAAHVLGAGGRGVEAADDRRAGRRADRNGRPNVAVDQAACGEAVQVGGGGVLVAVGAELGSVVLAGDPEDVGGREARRGLSGGRRQCDEQKPPDQTGAARRMPARRPTHRHPATPHVAS